MSKTYKDVDIAKMIVQRMTCGDRKCSECEKIISDGCSRNSGKIMQMFGFVAKEKGEMPPNGLNVCLTRQDGSMIVGHLMYDENTPMAWQNSADKFDLYSLDEIKEWAPIAGKADITI